MGFKINGFAGNHEVRIVLYLNGELFEDWSGVVKLSATFVWHKAWPLARSRGTYSVEVFVDGVLVGIGKVEAP